MAEPAATLRPVPRAILIAAGTLFLGLGALGIVVPGLPTTPFLLLAGACYVRSSDRLYRWMHDRPWLRPALAQAERFHQRRALPLRVKVTALACAWGSLALTATLGGLEALSAIGLTLFAALSATVAMVWIKTEECS